MRVMGILICVVGGMGGVGIIGMGMERGVHEDLSFCFLASLFLFLLALVISSNAVFQSAVALFSLSLCIPLLL